MIILHNLNTYHINGVYSIHISPSLDSLRHHYDHGIERNSMSHESNIPRNTYGGACPDFEFIKSHSIQIPKKTMRDKSLIPHMERKDFADFISLISSIVVLVMLFLMCSQQLCVLDYILSVEVDHSDGIRPSLPASSEHPQSVVHQLPIACQGILLFLNTKPDKARSRRARCETISSIRPSTMLPTMPHSLT